MANLRPQLLDALWRRDLVDSHEHLLEEDTRLAGGDSYRLHDIGILFCMYIDSDMRSAGMTQEELVYTQRADTPAVDKWAVLRRYWPSVRHTGYGQAIRDAVRLLFNVADLNDGTWEEVNAGIRERLRPGCYRDILRDVAKLDHVQVNSFEDVVFRESQYPDLLLQDMSFLTLSTDPQVERLEERTGRSVRSFDELVDLVDHCFRAFGRRAVAIKNQGAYLRALDYAEVDAADARAAFDAFRESGYTLAGEKRKPLEDWLFHHCLRRAREQDLPVKLHAGYLAGHGGMPMERIARHPAHIAALARAHPETRLIVMHSIYPHQDEAIALAKHYPNVVIDLCWSWIINPAATVRFVKEFLMGVSANKLLVFGGDYGQVELIPGHASVARRGIAQALAELVEERWLREDELDELLDRLAFGNAFEHLRIERARANAAPPRSIAG